MINRLKYLFKKTILLFLRRILLSDSSKVETHGEGFLRETINPKKCKSYF